MATAGGLVQLFGYSGEVRPIIWLHGHMQFSECTRGGDVAQLVEHRTSELLTQVRIPRAVRDFFPRVNFQCRLSYGVRTPPCAIACINICTNVKDPVVHCQVRWIIGNTHTQKKPARTVGWVARLCRSWLSPGIATRISHGRNPIGTIQLLKKKKKSQAGRSVPLVGCSEAAGGMVSVCLPV